MLQTTEDAVIGDGDILSASFVTKRTGQPALPTPAGLVMRTL